MRKKNLDVKSKQAIVEGLQVLSISDLECLGTHLIGRWNGIPTEMELYKDPSAKSLYRDMCFTIEELDSARTEYCCWHDYCMTVMMTKREAIFGKDPLMTLLLSRDVVG